MFELLQQYLKERDYFRAGSLFTVIGELLRAPASDLPKGFRNAQIQFVPTEACLHVFVVLDNQEDFNDLPGDAGDPAFQGGAYLQSKTMHLGELWNPAYADGILFHFLFVDDEPYQTGLEEYDEDIGYIHGEMSQCNH